MKYFIFFIICSTIYAGDFESAHFVVTTNLSDSHAKRIAEWSEYHYNIQTREYGISKKLKSYKPIIQYTYGIKDYGYTEIFNHLEKPSRIIIHTKTIDELLDKSLPHELNHLIVLEHHLMRGHKGAILLEGLAGLYESKHRQHLSDLRMNTYVSNNILFNADDFADIENTRTLTDSYKNQIFYDQSRSFTKYVRSKLNKDNFRLLMYSLLLDVDIIKSFNSVDLNYYTVFRNWKESLK